MLNVLEAWKLLQPEHMNGATVGSGDDNAQSVRWSVANGAADRRMLLRPFHQLLKLFRSRILGADLNVRSDRRMACRYSFVETENSTIVAVAFDCHLEVCEIDAQARRLRGNHG